MKKIGPYVLVAVLSALVAIQVAPVDRGNPRISKTIQWDTPETEALARRACYDCHSNETVWPWYASVAPISWRIAAHVSDGRRHLNFSTWDAPNEDMKHVEEQMEEGEMPLKDYLLLHPEARLTPEETAALLEGFRTTFAADPPIPRPRRRRPGAEPAPETQTQAPRDSTAGHAQTDSLTATTR